MSRFLVLSALVLVLATGAFAQGKDMALELAAVAAAVMVVVHRPAWVSIAVWVTHRVDRVDGPMMV